MLQCYIFAYDVHHIDLNMKNSVNHVAINFCRHIINNNASQNQGRNRKRTEKTEIA